MCLVDWRMFNVVDGYEYVQMTPSTLPFIQPQYSKQLMAYLAYEKNLTPRCNQSKFQYIDRTETIIPTFSASVQ